MPVLKYYNAWDVRVSLVNEKVDDTVTEDASGNKGILLNVEDFAIELYMSHNLNNPEASVLIPNKFRTTLILEDRVRVTGLDKRIVYKSAAKDAVKELKKRYPDIPLQVDVQEGGEQVVPVICHRVVL